MIFAILVYSILISSCSDVKYEQIITKLQKENKALKKENSELRAFKDSLKITAYIDNTTFKTNIGRPYSLQLLTIIQDDMQIQDIYVNGDKVDTSENNRVKYHYTDFGPRIIFKSDTSGTFNFKVNTKFQVWNDKIVPLKWPITVTK